MTDALISTSTKARRIVMGESYVCGGPSAQRPEKCCELSQLNGAQSQWLQFCVSSRRRRSCVVVIEHSFEGRELACMHVRRAVRDIPQRRHFERTLEHVIVGDQEIELRALMGCIAPPAAAVELIGDNFRSPCDAALIRRSNGARGNSSVMKLIVAE